MTPVDPRIPVTLLTGFLGAGKTTLLNQVLQDGSAGRIAVIVNEFGDAGLDHDLIEVSDERVVLMESGCLCCSIRGDLAQTISELLVRRDQGSVAFDRIVIETTGLADPAPILQTLLVDRSLATTLRMDGVVTLADAAAGPTTLDEQFEAVSQIAMADLIVISKTDLVSEKALKAFQSRLRHLNANAKILFAERGDLEATQLFGLSGLRRGATAAQALDWMTMHAPDPFANLSGLAPKQEMVAAPPHDTRIQSVSIVLEDPLPDAAFDLWLDTLIALKGKDILRVKGIVFLKDLDLPFVFHGVQHMVDEPVQLKEWPSGKRHTRIVVIAKDIARPELQRGFDILRASQSKRAQLDADDEATA